MTIFCNFNVVECNNYIIANAKSRLGIESDKMVVSPCVRLINNGDTTQIETIFVDLITNKHTRFLYKAKTALFPSYSKLLDDYINSIVSDIYKRAYRIYKIIDKHEDVPEFTIEEALEYIMSKYN